MFQLNHILDYFNFPRLKFLVFLVNVLTISELMFMFQHIYLFCHGIHYNHRAHHVGDATDLYNLALALFSHLESLANQASYMGLSS